MTRPMGVLFYLLPLATCPLLLVVQLVAFEIFKILKVFEVFEIYIYIFSFKLKYFSKSPNSENCDTLTNEQMGARRKNVMEEQQGSRSSRGAHSSFLLLDEQLMISSFQNSPCFQQLSGF